jgi:hypothetical protein
MQSKPVIVPYSPDLMRELVDAASDDGHCIMYPSHVVKRDEQIIGYGSICVMPVAQCWLHSKFVTPRESLILHRQLDSIVKSTGHNSVITLCTEKSPFYPVMPKLGYTKLFPTTLFIKNYD